MCSDKDAVFCTVGGELVCAGACPNALPFKIERFLPVHGFECVASCGGGFAGDAGECVFSCDSRAFSEVAAGSGVVLRCQPGGCPGHFFVRVDARGQLFRLCVDDCAKISGSWVSTALGQCVCADSGLKIALNGSCVECCGSGEFLGASGDVCVQACPEGTVQGDLGLQCAPGDSRAAGDSKTAKILACVFGALGAVILALLVAFCVCARRKRAARRSTIRIPVKRGTGVTIL